MPSGVYPREEAQNRKRNSQTAAAQVRVYTGKLAQIAVRFSEKEYADIVKYFTKNNLSLSNTVRTLAVKSLHGAS